MFQAQVWREEYTSCIPDATTTRILRTLDIQQLLAVANAFDSIIAQPERRADVLREFVHQHCHNPSEIAAVSWLLGGERWGQYLPASSYIASSVNNWIRKNSFI